MINRNVWNRKGKKIKANLNGEIKGLLVNTKGKVLAERERAGGREERVANYFFVYRWNMKPSVKSS